MGCIENNRNSLETQNYYIFHAFFFVISSLIFRSSITFFQKMRWSSNSTKELGLDIYLFHKIQPKKNPLKYRSISSHWTLKRINASLFLSFHFALSLAFFWFIIFFLLACYFHAITKPIFILNGWDEIQRREKNVEMLVIILCAVILLHVHDIYFDRTFLSMKKKFGFFFSFSCSPFSYRRDFGRCYLVVTIT